jgi:hypothetical protein
MITTKTAVQCQVSLSLMLLKSPPTCLRASGPHFFYIERALAARARAELADMPSLPHFFYVERDIGGCAANVPFDINK